MFDHVTVRVSDHDESRRFYEVILAPLGHAISLSGGHYHEWNDFGIAQSREDRPVTQTVATTARSSSIPTRIE